MSLEWGREHDTGGAWTEAWSEEAFPDPAIRGYYVDLRYNGVTVKSDLVLAVDGGRACPVASRARTAGTSSASELGPARSRWRGSFTS